MESFPAFATWYLISFLSKTARDFGTWSKAGITCSLAVAALGSNGKTASHVPEALCTVAKLITSE